jgi:hypothetical protein
MSVAAVEQRLTALLDELEKGLRRSGAMDHEESEFLAETAPPMAGNENASRPVIKTKKQLSAEARAAAIILVLGVIASQAPYATGWVKSSSPSEAGVTNGGTEPAKSRGTTGDSAGPINGALPLETASQPSSASLLEEIEAIDAARPEEKTPHAASRGEAGGLSIEEFNAQVRRLLEQKRNAEGASAALAVPWPDGSAPANDAPSQEMQEPLPLPPPAVATPAASSPQRTEANVAQEGAAPAEAAEQGRTQPAPAVKAKGKGAAAMAKAKRAKVVSKPEDAPASRPAPPPASGGPIGFFQGAAEALTGVVKNLGRSATAPRP